LAPFLGVMGRSMRSKWAPYYVRGLLGPDGPKSVQPIAARLGLPGHDQLHHFVSSPAWDDALLWRVLAEQADRLVGGDDAVLVIDDTALPKKGTASVGVAGQYCGVLGQQANCQSLVSLTLARREVSVPIGLRLFPPAVWTGDPERCAKAGVPEAARTAQTKPEIALVEIDRLMAAGLRFGCVLADAGYGCGSMPCRAKWPSAPPTCWPDIPGGAWSGGKAPRAHSRPASSLCGCAWPMDRAAPAMVTCRARRSGSLANGAAAASGSTTSATCPHVPRCGGWPRRSRRAGYASKRTSNSSRSLGSAISRGDPGPVCTDMR